MNPEANAYARRASRFIRDKCHQLFGATVSISTQNIHMTYSGNPLQKDNLDCGVWTTEILKKFDNDTCYNIVKEPQRLKDVLDPLRSTKSTVYRIAQLEQINAHIDTLSERFSQDYQVLAHELNLDPTRGNYFFLPNFG